MHRTGDQLEPGLLAWAQADKPTGNTDWFKYVYTQMLRFRGGSQQYGGVAGRRIIKTPSATFMVACIYMSVV
jgi:hypothetical protein